jgi:hypothetical protein
MTAQKRLSADLAEPRIASDWNDLVKLHEDLARRSPRWVFRGHSQVDWELESGLERAIRRFDTDGMSIEDIEAGLVRQFARRAHHYLSDLPKRDAWVEWLALMQHHGAPTRLLDFTYSFYVALFFALEDAAPDRPCALWALSVDWSDAAVQQVVDGGLWQIYNGQDRNIEQDGTFKEFFASRRKMVFAINPYRLNPRLSIQQGIFLSPGDITTSFVENLAALGPANGSLIKCEIRLARKDFQDCVQRLTRMNMTRTSLFPGLDGFAMSQKLALATPTILMRDALWPTYIPPA